MREGDREKGGMGGGRRREREGQRNRETQRLIGGENPKLEIFRWLIILKDQKSWGWPGGTAVKCTCSASWRPGVR